MALSEGFDWSKLEGIDWDAIDTPEAWEKVVRERFPAFAWAIDHEELGPVIREAVEGDFTEETFDANLRATDWWTTRSEAERAWDSLTADTTNAGEVQRRIDAQVGALRDLAGTLGATIPAWKYTDLATKALREGLSDDEVMGLLLASSTDFDPGVFTATETAIRSTAADFMVSLDDEMVRSMASRTVKGELNEAGVTEFMRDLAKNQHPSLAGLIDSGVTVREYFTPHRNRIAEALGRTADQVDLTKEFGSVLAIGDGASSRPMTLAETDRYIRTLDEYWQRPGGQGEAELYGMTNALASALGRRR